MNAEIFERYVDTVPIPAVEANRQLPGCDKKRGILFCDNCSVRMSNSMPEVNTARGSCFHVPAAYITCISSSGRIIIRPCQAIQKISNT
jgi:hypothetical protein